MKKLLSINTLKVMQSYVLTRNAITANKFIQNKPHPMKFSQSFFSHSSIQLSARPPSPFKQEDFHFRWVTPKDYDEYFDMMMKYYVPRNELYIAMGIRPDDPSMQRLIAKRVKRWIDSGLSFCLAYEPTNEVATYVLNEVVTPETRSSYMEEDIESYSEPVRNMQKLLYCLEKCSTVFNDPSVKKLLCGAVGNVIPKFEGSGLLTLYMKKQIEIGKNSGCDGLIVESTNYKTQNVLTKMGHKDAGTINYADFEIDGKKVIDMKALKGTTKAVVQWLDLRN